MNFERRPRLNRHGSGVIEIHERRQMDERARHSIMHTATCICEDNGGNAKVESKRGKLFRDASLPETVDLTVDDDEEDTPIANQHSMVTIDPDLDESEEIEVVEG